MSYNKYIIANDGLTSETIKYSLVDVKTDKQIDDWSGEKLVTYSFIEKGLQSLTGRILTIIDASVPSGTQNKCIKDLIRKEFLNEFEKTADLIFDQSALERSVNGTGEYSTVGAEEILGA